MTKRDPYKTVGEVMGLTLAALTFVLVVLALLALIAQVAGVVFA